MNRRFLKIIVSFGFARSTRSLGATDFGLGYVVGLKRLGHEVCLIEEVGPETCFDEMYEGVPFAQWKPRLEFERLARSLGLWGRACLIYNPGHQTHGMTFSDAVATARSADLLLNFGGCLRDQDVLLEIPRRAYIDRNPATEQVYASEYDIDYGFAHHQYHFTSGLNIGAPDCEIPTCGCKWEGALIPVVIDMWPARFDPTCRRFTTITSWGGRETFNLNGRYAGEKMDEWFKFIDLPRRVSQELEIATEHTGKAVRPFEEKGWCFVNTASFKSLEDRQSYISRSRAEFTVSHAPFVTYNVGWCGDRISRYLAAGKPVLIQSCGFERHLPMGHGLVAFSTLEEAVAGIDSINRDYEQHCRAARAIAEDCFDSATVLGKILKHAGVS